MSKQIDGKRHYTLYEIVKEGLIPHIRTYTQMLHLAKTDKVTNNYLDAVRVPRGKNVQYQIKGANIIKYLVNLEN